VVDLSTPDELARRAAELERAAPQEILRRLIGTYKERVAVACSFGGPGGLVLVDMALEIDPGATVYFLDTGLLFAETYALVETIAARYGIAVNAVGPDLTLETQSERFGPSLWAREPDRCCALRKVAPQRAFLRNYDAWVSAIRRDQAPTRAATPVVQWDETFGLVKVNPLVNWDQQAVFDYLAERGIPYNPLHDQGYPSIGCTPCTRPVLEGEDPRAGRWSGAAKIECGLHPAGREFAGRA
jgi:phosphoadenosine phosphosulfate reductase